MKLSKSLVAELFNIGNNMPVFAGNLQSHQDAQELIDLGLAMRYDGKYVLTEKGKESFIMAVLVNEMANSVSSELKHLDEKNKIDNNVAVHDVLSLISNGAKCWALAIKSSCSLSIDEMQRLVKVLGFNPLQLTDEEGYVNPINESY